VLRKAAQSLTIAQRLQADCAGKNVFKQALSFERALNHQNQPYLLFLHLLPK